MGHSTRAPVISIAVLSILLVASSACFDPQFRDGQLTCSTGECPPGFSCRDDGFCYRGPGDPGDPDAAPPDKPIGIDFPIVDSFDNTDQLIDLSKLVAWGGNPLGTSSFALGTHDGRQAISLARDGSVDATMNAGLDDSTALRGFSSIDYPFAKPVDRTTSTLSIEFDVAWEVLSNPGERGKLHVIALHEYPADGPPAGQDRALTGNPYGRPAYTAVLRNRTAGEGGGRPFLFYGGGDMIDGQLGIFDDMWWLPGFVGPPGPGQVGVDPEFPIGSWLLSSEAIGSTAWQRVRFEIAPDAMRLFVDDTQVIDFALPGQSTAPLYRTFDTLRGVRIYWRGLEQAFVANLRVSLITQ